MILSSQQIFHKYTSWSSDFNAPRILISLHEWWDLFTLIRIKFYGVIVLMKVIFSLLPECPVAYESIAITKQTFIMTSLEKEMYNSSTFWYIHIFMDSTSISYVYATRLSVAPFTKIIMYRRLFTL